MMNQLSLLERRRFLETMKITMKQLPNNVVIVKIQANIWNKKGDIFFTYHGACLPRKLQLEVFPDIKQIRKIRTVEA